MMEYATPAASGLVVGAIIGFTWGVFYAKKDFYKTVSAHFSMRRK